jgi:hypothetical protein
VWQLIASPVFIIIPGRFHPILLILGPCCRPNLMGKVFHDYLGANLGKLECLILWGQIYDLGDPELLCYDV